MHTSQWALSLSILSYLFTIFPKKLDEVLDMLAGFNRLTQLVLSIRIQANLIVMERLAAALPALQYENRPCCQDWQKWRWVGRTLNPSKTSLTTLTNTELFVSQLESYYHLLLTLSIGTFLSSTSTVLGNQGVIRRRVLVIYLED